MNTNNYPSGYMATNGSYFCVFSIDLKCLLNMVEGISRTTQSKKKKQYKILTSLLRFQDWISAPRDNLALDTLDSKLNTVWICLPCPLCSLTLGLFIMLCTIKTTGLPAFRMASTACSWLASLRSIPSTCNGRPQLNISRSYRTTEQFVDLEFWGSWGRLLENLLQNQEYLRLLVRLQNFAFVQHTCGPLLWTLISVPIINWIVITWSEVSASAFLTLPAVPLINQNH